MIILNFGLEFRFLDRNRLLFLQCQCRKKYLILSFNFVKLYIDNSKFFHIRLLPPSGTLWRANATYNTITSQVVSFTAVRGT